MIYGCGSLQRTHKMKNFHKCFFSLLPRFSSPARNPRTKERPGGPSTEGKTRKPLTNNSKKIQEMKLPTEREDRPSAFQTNGHEKQTHNSQNTGSPCLCHCSSVASQDTFELLMHPPLPVTPRKYARLARCPRSKLLTDFQRIADLLPKARNISSSAERRLHRPPYCVLAVLSLQLPHRLLHHTNLLRDVFQLSVHVSTFHHSNCLVQGVTWHNPVFGHQWRRVVRSLLLPSKNQHLVSFGHTRMRIRVSYRSLDARLASLLCSLPARSTAMNCLSASMIRRLMLASKFRTTILHSFPKFVMSFKAQINLSHSPCGAPHAGKKHLILHRVTNLQGKQCVPLSPVVWFTARCTTTNR